MRRLARAAAVAMVTGVPNASPKLKHASIFEKDFTDIISSEQDSLRTQNGNCNTEEEERLKSLAAIARKEFQKNKKRNMKSRSESAGKSDAIPPQTDRQMRIMRGVLEFELGAGIEPEVAFVVVVAVG